MRSTRYPAQLNERAARITAGFVVALLASAWIARASWLLPLLALGFVVRASLGPRYSPLARLAAALATQLGPPRPVPAAPKRFAQGIGAVVLTLASGLAYGGSTRPAWALAGMLVVFASLEAVLGFCAGCWIFGRLQRLGVLGPAVCVDCAPARAPRGRLGAGRQAV